MDSPTPISGFNTYSQARLVYWQSDRLVHGPFPGNLAALQGLSPADRNIIVGNGTTWTVRNGQLPFPATQNPSADPNTLDDYEEGTWTPILTTDGVNFTSVSYSIQNGGYLKNGGVVHFWGRMATSTLTKGSASGNVCLGGLPFSMVTGGGAHANAMADVIYAQGWTTQWPTGMSSNQATGTKMVMFSGQSNINSVVIAVGNVTVGVNDLIFFGSYRAD